MPHPWIDVFLPPEATESFVRSTVANLRFDDVGEAGFVLLFPIRRNLITRRFFNVPESTNGWFYLFDILPSAPAPGPNSAWVAEKLQRNRNIYEQARALGGKFYSISAVSLTPADWAHQFGARYAEFTSLKNLHDPDRVLTPGPNVF